MADEVAMLMGNLKFSEEELSKMENVDLHCKEQLDETEQWVVAKLFRMRKVEGAVLVKAMRWIHVQVNMLLKMVLISLGNG
ncbi:hypothetical protein V6N13_009114 [Hibiscus sabdariffa]|uniref:Uncharacterized protein n=1 Tax=Hibiscus sabdariffa TaxID=183260 RepID=A0ABR2DH66_9ROSI